MDSHGSAKAVGAAVISVASPPTAQPGFRYHPNEVRLERAASSGGGGLQHQQLSPTSISMQNQGGGGVGMPIVQPQQPQQQQQHNQLASTPFGSSAAAGAWGPQPPPPYATSPDIIITNTLGTVTAGVRAVDDLVSVAAARNGVGTNSPASGSAEGTDVREYGSGRNTEGRGGGDGGGDGGSGAATVFTVTADAANGSRTAADSTRATSTGGGSGRTTACSPSVSKLTTSSLRNASSIAAASSSLAKQAAEAIAAATGLLSPPSPPSPATAIVVPSLSNRPSEPVVTGSVSTSSKDGSDNESSPGSMINVSGPVIPTIAVRNSTLSGVTGSSTSSGKVSTMVMPTTAINFSNFRAAITSGGTNGVGMERTVSTVAQISDSAAVSRSPQQSSTLLSIAFPTPISTGQGQGGSRGGGLLPVGSGMMGPSSSFPIMGHNFVHPAQPPQHWSEGSVSGSGSSGAGGVGPPVLAPPPLSSLLIGGGGGGVVTPLSMFPYAAVHYGLPLPVVSSPNQNHFLSPVRGSGIGTTITTTTSVGGTGITPPVMSQGLASASSTSSSGLPAPASHVSAVTAGTVDHHQQQHQQQQQHPRTAATMPPGAGLLPGFSSMMDGGSVEGGAISAQGHSNDVANGEKMGAPDGAPGNGSGPGGRPTSAKRGRTDEVFFLTL